MPEKKGLDLDILKQIIQIMKDDDLCEVCIEQNDVKIQVKRGFSQPNIVTQDLSVNTANTESAKSHQSGNLPDDAITISAPMVGTFYRSASADAAPYVKVGDTIKAGDVICIIEAMKLMNEITAELDCEIEEILLEDGQPVEYDQPIFRIRPK
jgi:acetyl-CoA carboxylase biotin carboxyl carrier protein